MEDLIKQNMNQNGRKTVTALIITGAVIWLVLLPFYGGELIHQYYYMPILGIMAATVANTTPVAAGIVYFPVLTLLNITPIEAIIYTMMIQTYGMGLGTVRWFIEDRRLFLWKVLKISVFWGSLGAYLGINVLTIDNPASLKMTFNIASIILVSIIFYSVIRKHRYPNTDIRMTLRNKIILSVFSLAGGIFAGWLGFGVDTIFYFLLTLGFRIQPAIAIVSSIALMTGVSAFGTITHAIIHTEHMPVAIWFSALPGVTLGGIFLASYLVTRVTMKAFLEIFIVFMVAEFCVISAAPVEFSWGYIIQFAIVNALVLYLVYIHIRLFRQSYVDFWVEEEKKNIHLADAAGGDSSKNATSDESSPDSSH